MFFAMYLCIFMSVIGPVYVQNVLYLAEPSDDLVYVSGIGYLEQQIERRHSAGICLRVDSGKVDVEVVADLGDIGEKTFSVVGNDRNAGLEVHLSVSQIPVDIYESALLFLRKVKYVDAETEDDAYGDAQLSAGISIDANGNWTENQNNVITLEANEDETKDGILGLTISNYGVALEAGQTIDAKIAFEKDFWRYLVNVSFVEANAYAGVNEVKVTPKTNVMYDLQGRQLINAAKGLYIMNGKKVLVK